jgi:hypothetical protein
MMLVRSSGDDDAVEEPDETLKTNAPTAAITGTPTAIVAPNFAPVVESVTSSLLTSR